MKSNTPIMRTAQDIIREYPDLGMHLYGLKCLAKEGKVKSVKMGVRTYINVQSLFDYLNGESEEV